MGDWQLSVICQVDIILFEMQALISLFRIHFLFVLFCFFPVVLLLLFLVVVLPFVFLIAYFVLFSSMEGMTQGWGENMGEPGGEQNRGTWWKMLKDSIKKLKNESSLLTLHTCRFLRSKIFPNRKDYVMALQHSERMTSSGSEQLTAQSIRLSLTKGSLQKHKQNKVKKTQNLLRLKKACAHRSSSISIRVRCGFFFHSWKVQIK